jgi:hypothetical protein
VTVTGTTTLAYPVAEKVTFDVPAETPVTVKDAVPPAAFTDEVTVATPSTADTALITVSSGTGWAVLEIVTVTAAPTATDEAAGDASSPGRDDPEMFKPLLVPA